jgi:hypothetical protein
LKRKKEKYYWHQVGLNIQQKQWNHLKRGIIMSKQGAMGGKMSDRVGPIKEAGIMAKQGKDPKLDKKYMDYCAPMMNNGEHAQSLARSLTAGLDKSAFPVK